MKITAKVCVALCAAAPLLAFGVTDSSATNNAGSTKPLISPDDLFTNSILAKGKGVSVTRTQLDQALVNIKAGASAQGRSIPPEDLAPIERQVLQNLITRQLLLAKATDNDKAKGKEKFESYIQKLKANAKLSDEEFNRKLNQQLPLMGLTREQWEKQGIDEATVPNVLERELKISVTDDQSRKFYDENPGQFEKPEMVRAAHILIGTRDMESGKELTAEQKAAKKKLIEDILKRARAGEDFGKLAKEYSEDPGSKDKGGEYTFPRGRMVPEFEAAAFSLNTNQVSDVVTTQFGYHIIKLYEKIPAKKVDFAEVSSDIKDYLAQKSIQKQLPSYVDKLEKEANVEILDEKLKPVESESPLDVPSTAGTNSPADEKSK